MASLRNVIMTNDRVVPAGGVTVALPSPLTCQSVAPAAYNDWAMARVYLDDSP